MPRGLWFSLSMNPSASDLFSLIELQRTQRTQRPDFLGSHRSFLMLAVNRGNGDRATLCPSPRPSPLLKGGGWRGLMEDFWRLECVGYSGKPTPSPLQGGERVQAGSKLICGSPRAIRILCFVASKCVQFWRSRLPMNPKVCERCANVFKSTSSPRPSPPSAMEERETLLCVSVSLRVAFMG